MDIGFPYHFDNRGRTATSGYDLHIRDLIEQLLFTSPGERVNRPDFGSGVLSLVFSPNSPELAAAMQAIIQAALIRWLGDLVEIQGLDVRSEDSALRVTVQYWVRPTGEQRITTFERSIP